MARVVAPNSIAYIVALSLFLTGCASNHGVPKFSDQKSHTEHRITDQLIIAGLGKLKQGEFSDASRVFNVGLKLVPEDARLHFLNGLSYHLLYLAGDHSKLELARAGYQMALSADSGMSEAAFKLGRLELEAGRPNEAAIAFHRVLLLEPERGEAHLGLAAAHYYLGEVSQALKTANRAKQLLTEQQFPMRAATLIHAAAGDDLAAREALSHMKKASGEVQGVDYVERRIGQWRAWHANQQVATHVTSSPKNQGGMAEIANVTGSLLPGPFNPIAAPDTSSTPRHWADCGNPAPTGSAFGSNNVFGGGYGVGAGGFGGYGNGGAQAADESNAQNALPAPCPGTPPRMALIDVTIIRTEDNTSRQIGINLLSGLNYVLTNNFTKLDTITRNDGGDTRNVVITRQQGAGLNGASGITYSLNIANATDSRSDILAQPSLVALDRQPSTFFSGRVLTLGLPGMPGSTGSFIDKPAGVSLSVTPTFVDNDTLLVAVRATRSFFEPTEIGGNFTQSMQTSRNAVSANVILKFGETLILSGLKEEEVMRETDGVPILQEIPAIRHLFRRELGQRFTKSVLITLSPRRSVDGTTQQTAPVNAWRLQARPQDIYIDWSAGGRLANYLGSLESQLLGR